MHPSLTRSIALFGTDMLNCLQQTRVLIVGIGAVGGACAESLARSGIGTLILMDGDCFDITNLNRQPFASLSAVGRPKTDVTAERLHDIAPTCIVETRFSRLLPEDASALLTEVRPDTIIDAIDDLPAKLALLEAAHRANIPIRSAMGAARKTDPTRLRITDISKTQVCPLARAVRLGLRARGITRGIRCVWSDEPALPLREGTLGSCMPVTAAVGLLLAADLLRALTPDA